MRIARLAAAACSLAAACAWSNPENRVVWNAFESNAVPENEAVFYATLPLTVPLGFTAIVVDTLVVHPVQVLDDAARDARSLWEDLDWRRHYYTLLGFLPLRALATPLAFTGSVLGRACFDIAPHGPRDPAQAAAAAATSRRQCLEFLAAIERGEFDMLLVATPVPWDSELDAAFARALRGANAQGRLHLYETGTRHEWPPLVAEPWRGLRDPDPVVRYFVLRSWSRKRELPTDLRAALLADPSESVRDLAAERLP